VGTRLEVEIPHQQSHSLVKGILHEYHLTG